MMHHAIRRATVIAGVMIAVIAVSAAAADAATDPEVTGTVEAGAGLNVHSGSPTGEVTDTMPGGSSARIFCWTQGPWITAVWGGHTWTTNVWDAIDGYTTPSGQNVDFVGGGKVFSTDAWINTGGDTSQLVRHC